MVRSSISRKRVDDGDADAVQAAGHLVGIVVRRVLELPAGMELGHDDLGGRHAFLLVDAGRDAAAIVLDADRAVGVEGDQDPVAMAGQRLVDRIVGDLEHHVVEARAVVGVADIHSGPLADRVEAFQHLDGIGAVAVFIGGVCHATAYRESGAETQGKRPFSTGGARLASGANAGADSDQNSSGAAAEQGDLDPAVEAHASAVALVGDRVAFAMAGDPEAGAGHAHLVQRLAHALRPPLGEVLIVGVGAARIGMAVDRDADARIGAQIAGERTQPLDRARRSTSLSVANSTSSCMVMRAPSAVWRKL